MGERREDMRPGRVLSAGFAKFRWSRAGRVVEEWEEHNLIPNDSLDDYLDARLKGAAGAQASTWFVGLILGDTTAITLSATDTMSAHGGWSESTHYSEGTRVSWDAGAVASQSVSNSTSTATFSINTSTTLGGCFLASTNTKGGAGGLLHSEIKFSQTRSLSSGDTLDVTYTQTMAFSST